MLAPNGEIQHRSVLHMNQTLPSCHGRARRYTVASRREQRPELRCCMRGVVSFLRASDNRAADRWDSGYSTKLSSFSHGAHSPTCPTRKSRIVTSRHWLIQFLARLLHSPRKRASASPSMGHVAVGRAHRIGLLPPVPLLRKLQRHRHDRDLQPRDLACPDDRRVDLQCALEGGRVHHQRMRTF